MSVSRRITVEVPAELLARARASSGRSISDTARRGLELVVASEACRALRVRRGQVREWPTPDVLRSDRR